MAGTGIEHVGYGTGTYRYHIIFYGYDHHLIVQVNKVKGPFKQVFVRHVKTLPREQPKILLGDNLAAHLSPYVIMMCQLYNIRYG